MMNVTARRSRRARVAAGVCIVGGLLLAACETAPAPHSPRPGGGLVGGPFGGPVPYLDQAHAEIQPELRLCDGEPAYNSGPVGEGGLVLSYSPFLETSAGPIARTPTEGVCLSSGFGFRPRATGGGRDHGGIDLAPRGGRLVFAAASGRVIGSGWSSGYGLTVRIDHGAGVETLYAHLDSDRPVILEGAQVVAGQPIATMGQTGNATGVHLHYEIRVRDEPVNPLR